MVSVVGVGPGSSLYLTALARQRIEEAEVLMGGVRLLALFPGVRGKKIPLREKADLERVVRRFQRVVVLASGDPLLFGVTDWVLSLVPPEEVEIVPGVSSFQYMLARLRVPLKDVAVVSLHGREGEISHLVRAYQTVVVFTDTRYTPVAIARMLLESGLTEYTICVGEQLSYEDESIRYFSVEELAQSKDNFRLNLVVIQRCIPSSLASPTVYFDVATSP
ncbi:MAG: precorrin-6y C5,15-methyltransferase (decarboxylating) subunit CbiE [Atribacterota bacterium]